MKKDKSLLPNVLIATVAVGHTERLERGGLADLLKPQTREYKYKLTMATFWRIHSIMVVNLARPLHELHRPLHPGKN